MEIKFKKTFLVQSMKSLLKKSLLLLGCLLTASTLSIYAQTNSISGTVTDTKNEPLIGVSVRVQGTTTGTVTDIDGTYSIAAKNGDLLEFYYIGMKSQVIKVASQTKIDVKLEDDSQMLTEVVAIGYGGAKAKDLTSPISTIKGDDINKQVTASPMQGLQGKIPGLQVINTGQPGSSPTVRIRGIGSIEDGKDKPLFVVDGMFFDNIDFLGNGDIENISVLKDASACAIYGVRAGNGVIIVTTKKGIPNRKPQIVYDGYFGIQKASNIMKMANTEQYVTMIREIAEGKPADKEKEILNSIALSEKLYGGSNGIPSTNTDWYSELIKVAPMHNHSISITGGSENTSYSIGASYLKQDGITNYGTTDYERINLRSKVDVNLTSWFKVGANLGVISSTQNRGNNSAWGNAFVTPSMMPIYDPNNKGEKNPKGYASTQSLELAEFFWNPAAIADYYTERIGETKVLPSVYAELSFLDNKLTIKSAFSQSITLDETKTYRPEYVVSSFQRQTPSELQKKSYKENNWVLDNTITYRDNFDKHTLTAMLGNSFRKDDNNWMKLWAKNVPGGKEEYWYITQGNGFYPTINPKDKDGTWPDDGLSYRGTSFFGRIMYDYDGKYLVSATMRADGSTKFQGSKWGYFPSVGLGWILTEENFLKDQSFINFLKLRASWGLLGNENVEMPAPFVLNNAFDGAINDKPVSGTTSVGYASKLKWEVVNEMDFGFDLHTLNNRLSVEFDYYNRKTQDAVFKRKVRLLNYEIVSNGGEIENSGLEINLNWNDKIGKDLNYNIGLNASTLKNKVTKLDGADQIIDAGDINRIDKIGEPVQSFFGYKVEGIYQTQNEIDNDPTIAHIDPLFRPTVGSFKYKDLDGDGSLSANDRDILGSPIPKFFIGGNIGFDIKNWDFNMAFQGQFGHKIVNMKRLLRQKQYNINFDEDLVKNRWTGNGSTNKYPSAPAWESGWNYKFNDFFTENASTFTIQNIQLGYTFQNIFATKSDKQGNKSSLRLSLTAQRPFNFFSYNGFTTEIKDGVDHTVYPMVSTYTIGAKLTF